MAAAAAAPMVGVTAKEDAMPRTRTTGLLEPSIRLRGDAADGHRERAMAKLRAACMSAPRPVILGRLELATEPDPAVERPAIAKATIDVDGQLVRAHVACRTMDQAIDLLAARVRRNIRALAARRRDLERRPRGAGGGVWRHDHEPAHRPEHRARPVADRRLARRKSLPVARVTPEQAAFDMRMLDHDFHLFTDAATGTDCLIHRTADGGLALVSADPGACGAPAGPPVAPAIPMEVGDALAALDATDGPFVAFVDPDRGRLMVAYRRYDGHYGLLGPADRY
ncbi:sigma 54 modulation/S30EA ribosomal C-terminal domain-containing protein [Miltoncostaea marina]|uniref:sigma 54 modulation/S30EA ribosomal C-terminal domain-containing protein n=1 Tax=Miltoncostaea marina TaxID=2843215 RepID=UPI001C3E1166|nr:sigma 54 modulation/S30EA ribosomal C-terminal domain-containing protein [Miltoncostaea marina]